MRVSFPAANERERKASFNNTYFDLNLQPDTYLEAFESEKTLKKVAIDSLTESYPFYLYAKGKKSNRTVHVKFSGDLGGTTFKRGVLVLRLKNGKFVGVDLYQQKKRLLGMLGYATTFVGFSNNLKRSKAGVQLVDDGGQGPFVTSAELIREAAKSENRNSKSFKEIAAKQE